LSCPVLACGCFGSVDSDHPDLELHAPVLHDKGVAVDHTVDFVLTSKGDCREQEHKEQKQYWEDDPMRTGHLTTFSLCVFCSFFQSSRIMTMCIWAK
jgi:hypothetical protein